MFKKSIVIVSSLVILAGCSTTAKEAHPESHQATPTSAPVVPTATPVPTPATNNMTIDAIKSALKQGMSKAEVEKLLGPNYKELHGEDGLIWRYDDTINNYKFESHSILVDEVDTNGLKNGSMKQQFFFSWHEDQLNNFALYYRNKDNKLEEYNVFGKGVVKTTPFE
ncbi:hypothetical protein NV379_19590 [Paenibacillus sp. N1-5-1-14]|uniref:hypothetical protein n=1 Tax=Paenibacillus radicibacter TaxID=2972488 RepID=UPI002158C728|nr:hypothetical protein [Paenibacillus radicibacter]MCR8644860.1 hypothetical protein [Paenibacillus radicibacter]